jgi:glycosyltransferase involved in cell wall biosynthesis
MGLDLERDSRSPGQAITHNLRKIRGLRRALVAIAPDVIVSFMDRANVLTLLASTGLAAPVIISDRVHPAHAEMDRSWSMLRWLTYGRADRLVVQTDAARAWIEDHLGLRGGYVIPNPIATPFLGGAAEPPRSQTVLAVGRLSHQKGFDVLIEAFAAVASRHPAWSLVIAGQGPEEERLRTQAARLLEPTRVVFLGRVADLERHYRTAGLFVLPSRFEGFPNALLEAMASGCAAIATNCPAGPADIVHHGVDGVLVAPEDVRALSAQMDRLMGDDTERRRLGARARDVSRRFGIDTILGLWDGVLADVGHGAPRHT